MLWFAFKLVSLNHWKQHLLNLLFLSTVVICFQISIFEPLKTAEIKQTKEDMELWFAFKLVSLNHWKQQKTSGVQSAKVVICFQISIFEPLKTARNLKRSESLMLWFAFKLVSLNHWKQQKLTDMRVRDCCDLLSN